MKWLRKHRPAPGTAFGFAALMVALGGVAFAAIPDSDGTIHGCFKNNGNLRVVESAADCRNSESSLAWKQQGPQGATGPAGPSGPPGGPTVKFDEQTGSVSTTSLDTPVDLGGPSVTVNVGPSGLVEVFARADLDTTNHRNDFLCGEVFLSEATDVNPPLGILLACRFASREWTAPQGHTTGRQSASWLVFEATPGVRTFTLKYQRSCSNLPCTSAEVPVFSNRKLWVAPVD